MHLCYTWSTQKVDPKTLLQARSRHRISTSHKRSKILPLESYVVLRSATRCRPRRSHPYQSLSSRATIVILQRRTSVNTGALGQRGDPFCANTLEPSVLILNLPKLIAHYLEIAFRPSHPSRVVPSTHVGAAGVDTLSVAHQLVQARRLWRLRNWEVRRQPLQTVQKAEVAAAVLAEGVGLMCR